MNPLIDINKIWMAAIRKNIKEVTFLAFENELGEYFVHVKLKNEFDGRDTIRYKMEEGLLPETMRSMDWEYIYNHLKNRSYEHK
jgi:hypothetical protein